MSIDISILKESFEAIKPVAGDVATHFYGVLFTDYPEMKPLFNPKKMEQQKKALIQSLVTIFDNLEDTEKLQSYLKKLGGRHHHYRVEEEHYSGVGNSLLKTLQYFFDDTWTPELAESWTEAIALIAKTMQEGAREAREAEENSKVVSVNRNKTGEDMKQEVEVVLKELMKESILDMTQGDDIKEMIRVHAKALLKEVLQDELKQLREKWKQQKAAA